MATYRVGVIRGGPSSEYDVSLKTGGSVLTHLPERYHGHDILITKKGEWYFGGLPSAPERIARQVDVIFNALHGEYGEDGKIQNQLDALGIPYTGSGIFASAVAMNKPLAKEIFRRHGLKTPRGILLSQGDPRELAALIFSKLAPPWVIKPADRGSSVGLSLVKTFAQLADALALALTISPKVLAEEYIRGPEATCGVVNHFRDRETYALPPIEIQRPNRAGVWGYEDKYSGATREICPANFSSDEKRALEFLAVAAHRALGLRHYSRADFIISPRGIYLLEVNTLPGLTSESLLPKALTAVGCSYPDFLDHILQLALTKR